MSHRSMTRTVESVMMPMPAIAVASSMKSTNDLAAVIVGDAGSPAAIAAAGLDVSQCD
jgi:hypothetical protein